MGGNLLDTDLPGVLQQVWSKMIGWSLRNRLKEKRIFICWYSPSMLQHRKISRNILTEQMKHKSSRRKCYIPWKRLKFLQKLFDPS